MKNHRFNPFRTGLAAATLTLLAAGPLWAANIWDGGGGDGFWNTPTNWDDDAIPGTAALTFTGDVLPTSTNNNLDATDPSFAGILFTNDGSDGKTLPFTLAGSRITLGGNIVTTANTTESTITDEISMEMILNGNRIITTNHLSSSFQHNLIISGNISESGTRNLTKNGSGQLTLTGSNSFSGLLTIVIGTLNANSIADSTVNSALGKGSTIRIGTSAATGTLNLTAGAANTNRQIQIGNDSADGAHVGGARINNNTTNGAGTLVFTNANFNPLNGAVTVARTLTLGGANTDANEIQGIIADNSASGTIGVTKEDAGTWILSGSNTYTGDTTVNAGTLALDGDSIADTGKLVIAGGMVDATGSETVDTLFFGAEQQAAGTWGSSSSAAVAPFVDDTRFSGSGVVVVSAGPSGPSTLFWNGTGTWTDASSWSETSGGPYDQTWTSGDHAVFDVADSTIIGATTNFSSITANEGVTFTAGGTLGTGGTVATITVNKAWPPLNFNDQAIASNAGFIKDGIGPWVLQGGNYTGNFTINAGAVAMQNVNALGGTSVTRTLTINGGQIRSNGSTARDLGTRFGGGIIIGGDITLGGAAPADGAMTFGNNVTLGAATRQITTDGTVTLSGIISGDSGVGITKAGAGTLTLTGENTYTGDTTVNDGTLAVDGDSIADTGKLVIAGGMVDATGSETVDTLFFGAVQQAAGTWGSSSSAAVAPFVDDTRFSGTGVVVVTAGPAPSSGYAAWQTANSTDQAANLDHDNDGVSNGVEHFLGGTGDTTGFTTPLPGVTNTAGTLSVTWVRHPDFPGFPGNYGTAVIVETSATLADPWTPAVEGVGAGFVEITGNDVKYTFPAGSKDFARLKVVTTP